MGSTTSNAQFLAGTASAPTDTLLANLPTSSPGNAGKLYFVTDLNGGTLFKDNGVSLVQQAPGVTEGSEAASIWASRGTGTVGARKRISDLGNNPLVEAVYNGSRWVPRSGEQLIYEAAPAASASGTTQTITLPNVTIPAGLMGLTGAIRVELGWELSAGTPLTRVVQMTWDGSLFVDDSASLHRRFNLTRNIRNVNAVAVQHLTERQADYASDQTVNTTGQDKTKDTSTDLVIAGSIVSTFGTAQVSTLCYYRIWWLGVGA